MEKKIKTESIVDATIRVSNADDTSRKFGIRASVKVLNDRVASVVDGTVEPVQPDGDPCPRTATFNCWEGSRTQFEFPQGVSAEERNAMLEEIDSFIESATVPTVAF